MRPSSQLLRNALFIETLKSDVDYAIFSILFVLFYITIHLESFFMAIISMLLIIMSFPVSYLIYTGIFQITMNTTLN